jgi:DNA-directed RNA polymerase subunit alpha
MTLETTEITRLEIKAAEVADGYGKFSVGPLERGYGMTLGNSLRRVLLSSIPGTAITWVKIDGVTHEYSTIPHVKEDVTELLLNFKSVRINSTGNRLGKLRLEVSGEGDVKAGDIMVSSDFEIMNPEQHIATLDSPEANFSVELNVEQGKGYIPATGTDGLPIGVLPVDSIFTPVLRVNFNVERTRVGQVTNYEMLVVEVWTDETILPTEALSAAGQILVDRFFLFANMQKATQALEKQADLTSSIPADIYNTTVEQLELSARTLNCLKRAHINRVGEVIEKTKAELLAIRNFGEKSLRELYNRLEEREFLSTETQEDQEEINEESLVTENTTDYAPNENADVAEDFE